MSKTLEKELEILRQKAIFSEAEITQLNIQIKQKDQVIQQKDQVIEQRDQVIEQQGQILEQKNEIVIKLETKIQNVICEYNNLKQAFLEAQRRAFGKKSERFVDDTIQQLPLFGADIEQTETRPEDIEKITYTRKKRDKSADLSLLPQREVIIEVPAQERKCECGCTKELINYEVKHILNYQKAIFEVIVQNREVLACKKCCQTAPVTAPTPAHILPKCRASESLLAYIAISKVLDRQPLYHLEKKIEREHSWRIPRQTMARWLIQLSEKLQPLVNLMKDQIINYDIAAIDATSLQVLHEPNRLAQTKSYAYCIRGGPPDKEVVLYEYNGEYEPKEYTHKQFVADLLEGFEGILHCDAADTFDIIGKRDNVSLSYCHAHARRKFEAIEKERKGKNKKGKPGLAHYVLSQVYQPLYKIEQEIKTAKMTIEQTKAYRQEHSKPILDAWLLWLQQHKDQTLPQSPIGKAIQYVLNQWAGLQIYLTDGRVQIDNNATEREIKPFVIARKNFLFSCTQAGADSLAIHFSLILTAKAHGLDPMAYYTNILKQIPACKSLSDYAKLLPWNFSK